uniref:C2H2-type domain-containing protein n=1 Tax=Eptatretus burgeri TaxID=7764 RepID=A0A8C4R8T1_EPTBU
MFTMQNASVESKRQAAIDKQQWWDTEDAVFTSHQLMNQAVACKSVVDSVGGVKSNHCDVEVRPFLSQNMTIIEDKKTEKFSDKAEGVKSRLRLKQNIQKKRPGDGDASNDRVIKQPLLEVVVENAEEPQPSLNRAFKCKVCSRTFRKMWYLKSHMRQHKETRNFACNLCKRSFKESWNLANHMRVHENKITPMISKTQLKASDLKFFYFRKRNFKSCIPFKKGIQFSPAKWSCGRTERTNPPSPPTPNPCDGDD